MQTPRQLAAWMHRTCYRITVDRLSEKDAFLPISEGILKGQCSLVMTFIFIT